MPLVVFLAVLVGLAAIAVGLYNRLVGMRNRVDGAWADIEVQLKRRHNLVANLVETVKGYAQHERGTLEDVIQARNRAVQASGSGHAGEAGVAEGLLGGALRQLFALSEAYPDLKANAQFLDLQRTLQQLESDIQNARRYYNAAVRDYNTRIQSIPEVFLARALGFKEREFFEIEEPSERQVPKVDFGTGA